MILDANIIICDVRSDWGVIYFSKLLIDSGMNKKKVEKGLEHCATNGSSKTSNGTKHHSSSHEDNQHRTSRSAGNSRNNSGGNNIKCDKKEIIDMEHSSVSTDSSTHSSNSTASKLSKVCYILIQKIK